MAGARGVSRRPGKAVHRPWCLHACRGDKAAAAKVLGVMRRPGKLRVSRPVGPERSGDRGRGRLPVRRWPASRSAASALDLAACRFPACRAFGRSQLSPKSTLMPKRTDLKSILIIGAGPIVIGQACEFDYSGTQACKALTEEGYRVILVNSNPATIMTDPEFADVTYIEPLTVEILEKIIAVERPSALLPTLGGQTALNLSMELDQGGHPREIRRRDDRREARRDQQGRGPRAVQAGHAQDRPGRRPVPHREIAWRKRATAAESSAVFRSSSARRSRSAAPAAASPTTRRNSSASWPTASIFRPVHEVLVEECLLGWKEYEMEVMRDHKDQCVVICSIENFDPMGVHTGDSITVAPAMTLTDKEYQVMRDASFAVIREIGVETGGSNIQFSVDPETGRMVVIEMNPRVSRSLGAGVEGHRLSHRQDRRQAGRRLHARRAAQRHHAPHAGELRADDRLRRDEDPAFHLREIPRRRRDADLRDEVGRRGDGDRPHVQGVDAEMPALARDRRARFRRRRQARRRRAGRREDRSTPSWARPTPSAFTSSATPFAPATRSSGFST